MLEHLQNLSVKRVYEGHRVKVKVTGAKVKTSITKYMGGPRLIGRQSCLWKQLNALLKWRAVCWIIFFEPSLFTRRLLTMGLHEQTSFISICLLYIPLPVIHRFLFDTDPLWHCLSIFSSVFPGFSYLILMLPMLLLVIWSYPSAPHARTTAVCVFCTSVSICIYISQSSYSS